MVAFMIEDVVKGKAVEIGELNCCVTKPACKVKEDS